MTLDLQELLEGWGPSGGDSPARVIAGRNNELLIQLRVDLGMIQMFPDGRPDGDCHRGCPTVLEHVRNELRNADFVAEADWTALERELQQFNYRRLALMSLIEEATTHQDVNAVRVQLRRALRDIDHCLMIFSLLDGHAQQGANVGAVLVPALIFHRARLLSMLREAESRVDEAIEELKAGALALEDMLARIGMDEQGRARDAGVAHLRELQSRLRARHGVEMTLQEQLDQAIEQEQFERAAFLRDELRRRTIVAPLRLSLSPEANSQDP